MSSTLGSGPTIFHNPRCSKSRAAMSTADELGVEVDEVRYLDAPPDRATLEAIVAGLEDPVTDLVRRSFGPLHLGTLPLGRTRELTDTERGALLTLARTAQQSEETR